MEVGKEHGGRNWAMESIEPGKRVHGGRKRRPWRQQKETMEAGK
jgi:hypothetical protein